MKKNLNKKLFSILIINLLIVGGFLFIFEFSSDNTTVEGTILTVNDDGGAMYTTIQSAINAANPGDTIYVWEGIYYENIIINKPLNLIGNGSSNTTIDGGGSGNVVLINANFVNISCLELVNNTFSSSDAGVKLDNVQYCKIENCNFTKTFDGILLVNSINNIISNSSILISSEEGIRFQLSDYNTVINNTISGSKFYDIRLDTSDENTILKNTLKSGNTATNIFLFISSSNHILNNSISNGLDGIMIQDNSNKNEILNNSIFNTVQSGICAWSTSLQTEVHYNNIFNNSFAGIIAHSNSIINATHNWWGNASGPYHSTKNPTGTGDNVSDDVIFIPWLTEKIGNNAPYIETSDNVTAFEDVYYEIKYSAKDPNNDQIIWTYKSNASWLYWDTTNHILNGTPTNVDVGTYWVSINVSDKFDAFDENNFTLKVINVKPSIMTSDITTIMEDSIYHNDYDCDDDGQGNITWKLKTNAKWLSFDMFTGILNGTPKNNDVGINWIDVSVNDGNGGINTTNFTLTVQNTNDAPSIDTADIDTVQEDQFYQVIYIANEDDIGDILTWIYKSNATWLNWGTDNHTLYGIPRNEDVGSYWVGINISDGNEGYDEHNFTLTVLNVNDPPVITTYDIIFTNESELYEVDYNATDVDSPHSQQIWTLETNATWLSINPSTGVLSGTPVFSETFEDEYVIVAWWTVNVTVSDGDGGSDRHDFILFVFKRQVIENEPPIITTTDVVSATIDELYRVDYDAIDDLTPADLLTWSLKTDANWLTINSDTGVISGTPTSSDVGSYWVNVSVLDTDGGVGSHNFTLTVYSESNLPPEITTEDEENAVVGEEYSVDYEAEDDRTPVNYLQWSLATNASWLTIGENTGILSGKPNATDIGWYWVKISVFDGEDGWDYSNFTLYVTTEPITKLRPELSNPSMTPTSGDTETLFTFSVEYSHPDGDLPDSIQVVIDGNANNMESTNSHYEYSTKLSEGNHTYYFTTTFGELTVSTENFTTPDIKKAEEGNNGKPGDGDEDNTMLYALIGIVVVIIVVLILLFVFLKKKKGKEGEAPVGETQPPPPDEVPPEIPSEQPPTPVTPPPEQPPLTPTEAVTEPQMPQVEQLPVQQPVMQPTVMPQIIPTITQPRVTEQPESDEELEE